MTAAIVVPGVASAEPTPESMMTKLVGTSVFLDPGHQGNGHTENLARQVNDGRGGTKECQTTGMTSAGGVPEHTINWNVAQLVKASLETLGAKVMLSRADDSGWGGCVDERAAAASRSGADVAISIHADSAPAADHGFHLIVPALPIPDAKANEVQSGKGLEFSKSIRDAYVKSGFTPANYAGVAEGLQTRADIAGPALTTIPLAFLEMGNGANPDDAKLLETEEGQVKQAIAITTGVVSYLLGNTSATTEALALPSGSTPEASDASAKPRTSTPKSTPKTGDDGDDLLGTAVQLLSPLLSALGIGGGEGSSEGGGMTEVVTQLAETLLSVVMTMLSGDK
nr:N-acetylmuramoyl-L-alanine amidase [Aldersonia kunmingensis]